MKRTIVIIFMVFLVGFLYSREGNQVETKSSEHSLKTALLIIDVQDFYFPGGAMSLVNPEAASLNAKRLLEKFRAEKKMVIHIRHNAKAGADIHVNVKPVEGEKVISKDQINSFRGTDLLEYLKKNDISQLVICGMQTHMCVEGAVRAASDYDFKCILIHDACATRDLTFNGRTIKAEDVHASTLKTLENYAKVIETDTFFKEY